jgi:hypothetical protein
MFSLTWESCVRALLKAAFGATVSVSALFLASLPAAPAGADAGGWTLSYRAPTYADGGGSYVVDAVAATAPDDAWAVGGRVVTLKGQGEGVASIHHWDGTSWSQVALPGPLHEGYFTAVSALSPTDVWAVGGCAQLSCVPFAAHWNGTRWAWVSPPGGVGEIPAVAALGPQDAWVPVYDGLKNWNGTSWQDYTESGWQNIVSVSGSGPDDVWATGGEAPDGAQPSVLHWDGSAWTAATLPVISLPAEGEARPTQVVAVSQRQAWVAGYIEWPNQQGIEVTRPFLLHWNGTKWLRVSLPDSLSLDSGFTELAPDGAGGLWAVDMPPLSGVGGVLAHDSAGTWMTSALPPAPQGSYNESMTSLANVPASQDMLATVYYLAKSGGPRQAVFSYTP